MSDDRKPENREAGMPGEIAGSAPRKKRRWIYYIVAAVVVLAGGLAYLYFGGCLRGSGGADNTAGTHAQGEKYTCGMHPFIITDKPGNCPNCGMTLTKIEGAPAPATAAAVSPAPAAKPSEGARKILFYRNPMNPKITSQSPAKDEMGMDFVPVYEDETKGGGGAGLPEGYATVQVGAERIRGTGIQSAPATRETISHPVRAAMRSRTSEVMSDGTDSRTTEPPRTSAPRRPPRRLPVNTPSGMPASVASASAESPSSAVRPAWSRSSGKTGER